MNFIEEAAARAAAEGELSASQANLRSPTAAATATNAVPASPHNSLPAAAKVSAAAAGLQQEAQTWAMLQNRLDPRVHAKTMGVAPTDRVSAFGMLGFGMPAADPSTFVLNTATIPRGLGPESPPVSKPAPPREISEKRRQWLTQLMEKKRRAAERKAAVARGDPDPYAPSTTAIEYGGRKKRQPEEMSNSECDSDLDQAGVIKFRRTSRGSKVDSSSEVSDAEGVTPRANSSHRRRERKSARRRSRRRRSEGSSASAGSQNTSDQSSGELDEVFGKLNVDSNSSGGELQQTYTIDHLSFLEDSRNTHRNKGRIGSTDLGASLSMRGLGTSMRLDASLGQSLDDSVRFWEAETSAAQKDLQTFVNDFASNEDGESSDHSRDSKDRIEKDVESKTDSASAVPVVSSLFGVGGLEGTGEDDHLEKSWMLATDPQAMSANGMDISMMKSFDRSRKSPLQDESMNSSMMIMKSSDGKRRSPVPDESIILGLSAAGAAAAVVEAMLKDDELDESL